MAAPRHSLLSDALSRLPDFRGKGRLVEALGHLACHLGDARATCSLAPGVSLELDLRDRIQRQMWGGCYEPHVQRCLDSLLGTGDTFLDVGAHIGFHAVRAAARVGPDGCVHAFEPDPALCDRLKRNLTPFSWAEAHPFAVWETSGSLLLERPFQPGESGWGILTAVRNLGRGEQIPVTTVSLDDWRQEHHLTRARMIKIDAEGAEAAIVRGARSLLEACRPLLLLETNDILLRYARSSRAELAEDLHRLGYCVFALNARRLIPWPAGTTPCTEVLCLPKESSDSNLGMMRRGGFECRE